jgi:hypothetical protein
MTTRNQAAKQALLEEAIDSCLDQIGGCPDSCNSYQCYLDDLEEALTQQPYDEDNNSHLTDDQFNEFALRTYLAYQLAVQKESNEYGWDAEGDSEATVEANIRDCQELLQQPQYQTLPHVESEPELVTA